MIRAGKRVVTEAYSPLYCSDCGKYLGRSGEIDGHDYDDTAGWVFCPYCGKKMEDTL